LGRISRVRNSSSFQRKSGRKRPRSISLIVCEGETEQQYFEAARVHFGLSTAQIVLAENTEGSAPISVVECAAKRCAEAGGYEHVFCVFDRDTHESFERARSKVIALATRQQKPLPIKAIISVPCFEFWVLLHFERTDRPFPLCQDVLARIRLPANMPNYLKADSATMQQLMARVETAIANAQWLERRAADTNFDPYTSIHHLLRHFEAVARQEP
jgi:hypothetical protein